MSENASLVQPQSLLLLQVEKATTTTKLLHSAHSQQEEACLVWLGSWAHLIRPTDLLYTSMCKKD
jgi:hypothetical protein